MNKRFHTFAGISKTIQNLVRRGLRILAALALTFALLGMKPLWTAQAVETGGYTFVMVPAPSLNYVCPGEKMTISVSINRLLPPRPGDTNPTFDKISAVMVNAVVNDTNVGELTSNSAVIGWTRAKPDTAEFTFKAGNNPGRTKIDFKSTFSEFWTASEGFKSWLPTTADRSIYVEVRKCTYKVEMIFQEWMPYMGTLTGAVDSIKLYPEEPTKFTGASNFKFAYNFLAPFKCMIAKVKPVNVDYKARLADEDLYITFTIHTLNLTVDLNRCGKDAGSNSYSLNGGDMTVMLPRLGGIAVVKNLPYWHYIFIVTRVSE